MSSICCEFVDKTCSYNYVDNKSTKWSLSFTGTYVLITDICVCVVLSSSLDALLQVITLGAQRDIFDSR